MNILNLYAGIGGNRELWEGHNLTAVEFDPSIAEVYAKRFPQDIVIVADAHSYLEREYPKFDFIWASPPCPSHGQYRHNVGVIGKGFAPIMPDMRLYSEIVFLQHYAKGGWCVENVKPYYEPLINPSIELQRHLFWSNFLITPAEFSASNIRTKNKISDFDGSQIVAESKISNKRQALRNCVDPKVGAHVLQCFIGSQITQEDL